MHGRRLAAPLRTARLTLWLMLLLASLVALGGVRLARRETVERTPADRLRLQEFTDAFQSELGRLADLFQDHLTTLSRGAVSQKPEQARASCARLASVCALYVFRVPDAPRVANTLIQNAPGVAETLKMAVTLPGLNATRPPEVIIEEAGQPMRPTKTVVVPEAVFRDATTQRGWLKTPNSHWQAHWQRVPPDQFVVVLVETERLRRTLDAHLAQWIATPFTPIRESGELVRVRSASGVLAGIPDPPASPMALTTPLRNLLGSWEISAWDRTRTRVEYSPAGISAALCAGALLALLGVLLFQQQRRALRLAEERVSFVNRVSHELGAPLTNALLNLSLADDSLECQAERARARLRLVSEEMQRLGRLVSNVLTFSKSDRGTLTLSPAPCVPDAVLAELLGQFEPALARRAIHTEWKAGAPQTVYLSADALAQIIGNLLSNAEKYAHAGGWLELLTHWENETLTVRVSDRGPGIPDQHRERIFQPFERVGSTVNEGSSGTGLGLAIARELAARMGGSLVLLPGDGGASFELRVPAPPVLTALQSNDAA